MFSVPLNNIIFARLVSLLLLLLVLARIVVAAEPMVNINHAGVDVLAERLSGIGPAKAKAIVIYRELHGPFKTIDELINVKGIGPRTLEKIRTQLVVYADDQLTKAHNAIAATASQGARSRTQANLERETRQAVRSVIDVARRDLDDVAQRSQKAAQQ